MFERIVAAIDSDTDRASQVVQAAQQLGAAFGSDVLVAHVRDVERTATMVAAAGRAGLPPSISVESEEAARELVDRAVNQLRGAGVRARGEVGPGATGSTARELLDIAQAHRADLIIVGDRDSRVTDIVLGGVAHRIVHLAPCPVMLVR